MARIQPDRALLDSLVGVCILAKGRPSKGLDGDSAFRSGIPVFFYFYYGGSPHE